VNELLIAHEDQWAFLAELRKITRPEAETIVQRAESKGRIVGAHLSVPEEENPTPWNRQLAHNKTILHTANLPKSLEIVVGNEIYIPKNELSPSLRNRLIRLAAFPNPEFYKAQAMRLPTHDKPRMITCANDYPLHIGLPRGCLEEISHLFADLKVKLTIREELEAGQRLTTKFQGELRSEQKAAATAMLKTNLGVLSATTAFGKTVIGAWLIAKRKVNTLIIVHRKQLQEQWLERLSTFLDLPRSAIGRIGGGRRKPTGIVDVAVIQSLVRKGVVDDVVSQYGGE